MLFDTSFFHRLKLLTIVTKRHFRGEKIGHRKSPNRGASVEFAEYREYQPGDDLRFLDWNLLARLQKPYIKKFHNEEELTISVLLDCSQSMAFGTPRKIDHARKLAAAIAFIAMQNQDSARVYTFNEHLDNKSEGGVRRAHIHRLMGFLEKCTTHGNTHSFEEIVQHLLLRQKRPGVVFIISDGMFGTDLEMGLRRLFYHRSEVNFVQVLSPDELSPDFAGMVDLIDIEDDSKVSLSMSKAALMMYEEVLNASMDELKNTLVRLDMRYYRSITSTPFESTLLELFQGARGAQGAQDKQEPGVQGTA